MSLQAEICPSCSAPITVPPDIARMYCPFCSTPLTIRRAAGEVSLSMGERITGAIQDSTAVTQAEFRRLQVSQELLSFRSQLFHIRSEIRALERELQTQATRTHLQELRAEATELEDHIAELRQILDPADSGATDARSTAERPTRGGHLQAAPGQGFQHWLWLLFFVEGRASRMQFLAGFAGAIVLIVIGRLLMGPPDADVETSGLACVGMPLVLAGMWMAVAVGVKRYHDRNKAGRWLLLGLIPLVGFWLLAEMAFFPSVESSNRFGPPPSW